MGSTPKKNVDANHSRLFHRLRRQIGDKRVIDAMERVPREIFIPHTIRHLAYKNTPLPIQEGQSISQPSLVALMTEALALKETDRVLEVGTGSGYQAAILAELTRWVISVERHPALVQAARQTLKQLGYSNINIHLVKESIGWESASPYDGIIVTAGAPHVPQELLDQLAERGRLVIPVGSRDEQQLLKITRQSGRTTTQDLGSCRFVPLIAEGAWEEF